MEPGQRFTLRGLAAAIGTSAMPVREAVTRLAAAGWKCCPTARSACR